MFLIPVVNTDFPVVKISWKVMSLDSSMYFTLLFVILIIMIPTEILFSRGAPNMLHVQTQELLGTCFHLLSRVLF
jgi:hypothetical protein